MCNSLQLCIDIFQFVPGTYHFLDILQRAHQCFRYDDPPRKILRSISPERDEELFEWELVRLGERIRGEYVLTILVC